MLGNIPESINYDFAKVPDTTNLSGVTKEGRQDNIKKLKSGLPVNLVRDYKNEYDKNAIKVFAELNNENIDIGWIPAWLAKILAPEIDAGIYWYGEVDKITGECYDTKGIVIKLKYKNQRLQIKESVKNEESK
jgi:hypothetical protein